jgi:hypothetical protein
MVGAMMSQVQRRAVMHGDDADRIILAAYHHSGEALALFQDVAHLGHDRGVAQCHGMVALIGEDDELHRVDGIDALAQDAALRPTLAAAQQEAARIFEGDVVAACRQGLARLQRSTATREDIADRALRHGDEALLMDAILERHQEMHAAAQDLRPIAGAAVERKKPVAH